MVKPRRRANPAHERAPLAGSVRPITGSQSAHRVLALFEYVCTAEHPVTLLEASEAMQLSKPTAFRLLQTLINFGLLAQDDDTKSYRPGLRLMELYYRGRRGLDPFVDARPATKRLSEKFNETVHLGTLDRGQVVYLHKDESTRTVRMFSTIGRRAPAHCTGLGKALLAYLPAEELVAVVRQHELTSYTATTITDFTALQLELATIRERGYSLDNGEHEPEIRCVACPVTDGSDHVVAAVSLTAPKTRFDAYPLGDLVIAVQEAAKEISASIGGLSPELLAAHAPGGDGGGVGTAAPARGGDTY